MTWLSVPLRNETVYIDLDKVKVISIWEKKVEFTSTININRHSVSAVPGR
jgi:hypothetical protein